MDGARDAVVELVVHLGEDELALEGRLLLDVLLGRTVNHVSDHVLLDGLVFWHQSVGSGADDVLDVTSVLSVLTVVSSLVGHLD